jgi:PEP-CTERM motif
MKRLICSTLIALSFAGTAQANLLTNPSFEAVDASASPFFIRSFASTPGWTQFLDGVDLIHNSYTQPPPVLVDASDGVQFLDMNQASAGGNGGLFQVVAATVGVVYNLSLDTTAWATNARGGKLGYQLYDPATNTVLASGDYTDSTGGAWITRSLSAAATSTSIGVRIQSLVATQAAMGLDNVVLTAVPEPGNWALMLGGLAMLGWVARRRG